MSPSTQSHCIVMLTTMIQNGNIFCIFESILLVGSISRIYPERTSLTLCRGYLLFFHLFCVVDASKVILFTYVLHIFVYTCVSVLYGVAIEAAAS